MNNADSFVKRGANAACRCLCIGSAVKDIGSAGSFTIWNDKTRIYGLREAPSSGR